MEVHHTTPMNKRSPTESPARYRERLNSRDPATVLRLEPVRQVSAGEEGVDRLADVLRELDARAECAAEAVQMQIRIELSEQAHFTVEEEAIERSERAPTPGARSFARAARSPGDSYGKRDG
jgi:hypothetical protein